MQRTPLTNSKQYTINSVTDGNKRKSKWLLIDANQIDEIRSLQQYLFSHKPYNWIKQQTKQKLTLPEPFRTKQNMLNIGTIKKIYS